MNRFRSLIMIFFILTSVFICACQTKEAAASSFNVSDTEKKARDNTPVVLEPSAPNEKVLEGTGLLIDISNSDEGYICVKYTGSAVQIKFFVITPDEVRYTYDIFPSDEYSVLPLSGGNGHYEFDVRENVEGTLYSSLYRTELEVSITDEFKPFLYPNQYTNFNRDSKVVQKAMELSEGVSDDLSVIKNVYDYVIKNIKYDYDKAASVEGGYLPVVDKILDDKKGICFDYASLMTAMLRSQGIPAKLEIGFSGDVYHAWISAYVKEKGWINNIVLFDGENWSLMDPTLASNNDPASVKKYIGNGTNYVLKYSR